ncbi:MAG: zinc ribbon domain-containing protein [Halobacterium sp.]
MEWGLFVLAVLLVAALQFAVWRRLQSGEFGTSESPPRTDGDAAPRADVFAGDGGTDDPDVQLCPACGAQNDADYQFCRDCVSSLHP